MSFNEKDFRNCLGSFTTGVTVITAKDKDSRFGVTVNSFASVSLDPPLILFSLGKDGANYQRFMNASHFVVNILSEKQHNVSTAFATSQKNPWLHTKTYDAPHGTPLINGCLAHLECERYAIHDGGDHSIFIGKVTHLEHHSSDAPLLYQRGKYHTLGDAMTIISGDKS